MKLSTRSTYGLRALVELGLGAGGVPLSASVIAKQQSLSTAYLEQLLHRLKLRGLVLSIRGPKGGYLLAKKPQHLTIAEVVHVLDGTPPAKNGNGKSKDTPRHAQRIALAVFHCVHERLLKSLDEVTLKDLCDEVREQDGEALDHRYVFHI
ncbi:MAG: Rrf2 family transcriptional regulator [Candidatus Omnitrophica bacterium]|nr:Rrf2 family transcriptional regulator [Candidatus Omnitrophota bacterium]